MEEIRAKLSNKTVILGPTQIDSKLRQSIPSFSKYLWSLFISGIPIK